ncbi:LysR family transcriptional regulator [Chelativorans alearense]|uniref:LysR family transcriptional regulator n=1 Tax=Chelativorans alearense TaxID=2681495 RepID=UPI0013D8969D|nr:LysR family transcriptional regulator [Chelativorans alearense]
MTILYRRIKNLNWNLLKTFLVIAEEKSITRAADKLLVRQPSVTAALQKLEEALGAQLIQRDSRRFVLTSSGELLRQECLEIFQRVERIFEAIVSDTDKLTGEIRIMTISHLVVPALDEALFKLHQLHPSVSVRVEVGQSKDIVRAIAQKQAPFGFCLLPKPVAALDSTFIIREQFGIYCSVNHRMSGRRDVPIQSLREEAFIALACSQDGGGLEPMNYLRDGAGLGRRTVGSSPNVEEVRRLIAAGLGIGILPTDAVRVAPQSEQLWLLSTLNGALGADAYFVRNPEADLRPAERVFLDMLSAALPAQPELA